jgi:hypothetical protein
MLTCYRGIEGAMTFCNNLLSNKKNEKGECFQSITHEIKVDSWLKVEDVTTRHGLAKRSSLLLYGVLVLSTP